MLTFSVKLALRLLGLDGKLGRLNLPVGTDDPWEEIREVLTNSN